MISLSVATLSEFQSGSDPLALFAHEDSGLHGVSFLSPGLRKALLERAKEEGFAAKAGELTSFLASDGAKERRFLIAGLGKRKDSTSECLRKAAAALSKAARRRHAAVAVVAPEAGPVAEGLLLSSYSFDKYKKPEEGVLLASAALLAQKPADKARLVAAAAKAALYAEAVCFARDLVNEGPSDKTPASLAERAKALAKDGVTVEVLDKKAMEKLGMGSLLGVSRGSDEEPRLVHLTYKGKGKKKVALVGKGITFDSGGLSLKPAQGMETMKMDMAGAASVFSVFKVIARMKPKAEVHGFAALSYNLPGPDAVKPGDVLKAMNGKTIEVLNTDAEGRLVLADALAYACTKKVDQIIDLATLTGACTVALGGQITGAMTNDKALLGRWLSAAKRTGELFWELPLPKEYADQIKSKIADLQNIGKVRGEGGTLIGGLFLKEFVGETPWMHLDIAGPAWTDGADSYCPAGGTGHPVRTLLEYLGGL